MEIQEVRARAPFASAVAAFALAAAASVGCTPESVSRQKHEDAGAFAFEAKPEPASPKKIEDVYSRYQPEIETAMAERHAALSSGLDATLQSDEKDLEPRAQKMGANFLLNPNYYKDRELTASQRMQNLLSFYNSTLWALHKRDANAFASLRANPGREDALLDVYLRAAMDGCDAELRGCNQTAFDFFRTDPYTSKIVQIKAASIGREIDRISASADGPERALRLSLVAQYYRLLEFAHDLGTNDVDSEWRLAYLKRARDYAAYFDSLPPAKRARGLAERHGRTFEKLIERFQPDPKNPEFVKFIAEFRPWSRSRLEADPFPYGTNRMFTFAATRLQYAPEGEGAATCGLDPIFYSAIRATQSSPDPTGPSFTALVADLRVNPDKSKRAPGEADLLKGLNVVEADAIARPCFFDEYFFMVDRLYRGHLNVDEATEIWEGSRKNEARLLAATTLYMKIQTLTVVLETNRYMRSYYNNQQFNSTDLFTRVISESKDLSDRWAGMGRKLDSLEVFLGRQSKIGGATKKSFEETLAIRKSVNRNVKYLAVYPNMLMLSFFMSDLRSTITVQGWFGTITIATETIIQALLEGMVSPWFTFGTDKVPINKFETLYSFYYALAGGAFETFSVARDIDGNPAVTRAKFFRQVIKKYVSPEVSDLEEAVRGFRESSSSGAVPAARVACDGIRTGSLDFTLTIGASDAVNATLAGVGDYGLTAALQAFYDRGSQAARIRDQLEPKLALVGMMAEMIRDNYRALGGDDSEAKATMAEIDSYFARARRAELDLYQGIFDKHREFNSCLNALAGMERARIREALALEGKHLGAVYDELVKAAAAPAPDGHWDSINAKFGFLAKYDKLSDGAYDATQLDFMLRNAKRLEAMRPRTVTNFPPDVTRIDWTGSYRLELRDAAGEIKSRSAFVEEGLRHVAGRNGTFVNWMQNETKLQSVNQRIRTLVTLYKVGRELGLPREKLIAPDEVIDEAFNRIRAISLEPEDVAIMKTLGLQQRVPFEDLRNDLLFNKSNGEPMGLLEPTFVAAVDNSAKREEAGKFAEAMNQRERFLFDPGPGVEASMRERFRPMAIIADVEEREFDEAIKRREAVPRTADPIAFAYALDDSGNPLKFAAAAKTDGGGVVLLPTNRRRDCRAISESFHTERAGGYLKAKDGEANCDDLSDAAACSDRFRAAAAARAANVTGRP